jgi:hypothetical protein
MIHLKFFLSNHKSKIEIWSTAAAAPAAEELLLDLLVVCYEKIFGLWGSSLLGRMYRKVNWTKDIEYMQYRRKYIKKKFKEWTKLEEIGSSSSQDNFSLDIVPEQLQFTLKSLQFIRNLRMHISEGITAMFTTTGRQGPVVNRSRQTRSA